jgi:hypothetical protein
MKGAIKNSSFSRRDPPAIRRKKFGFRSERKSGKTAGGLAPALKRATLVG